MSFWRRSRTRLPGAIWKLLDRQRREKPRISFYQKNIVSSLVCPSRRIAASVSDLEFGGPVKLKTSLPTKESRASSAFCA